MKALITDWRGKWHRTKNFTFGIAQLAPSGDNSNGVTRWAMTGAAADLSNVHIGILTDLYDAGSPCGSVHIRNKTTVGARLSLGTLAMAYGVASTPYTGPIPASVTVGGGSSARAGNAGNAPATAVVEFGSSAYHGLAFKSVAGSTVAGATHGNFEVTYEAMATADPVKSSWGGWLPATSVKVISPTQVEVTFPGPPTNNTNNTNTIDGNGGGGGFNAAAGTTVAGIRHGWGNVPAPNPAKVDLNGQFLYDGAQLPARPFAYTCSGSTAGGGCSLVPFGGYPAKSGPPPPPPPSKDTSP